MPLIESIVESVAASKDVEHNDLEPLYDSIDSDAITPLIDSLSDTASLKFRYEGHSVTVAGDETVSITPL